MTDKFAGKIAVITGGSTGIGLATAKRFVQEGMDHVFITSRRKDALDQAVEGIGRNVTAVQGDVANLAHVDRLCEAVGRKKRKIDVIFANAGVAQLAPFGTVDEKFYDLHFDANVKGIFFTVQKALPLMNDGGSIMKDRHIRVNTISPGHIDTPIFESWQQGDALTKMKSDLARTVPLGRLGDPDEIAKAISFLASDEASYVAGIELYVDGGVAQI
jgi:NAD(P)-dependent dehydrogenase (short-subunit alcohol dehydrogenase family)